MIFANKKAASFTKQLFYLPPPEFEVNVATVATFIPADELFPHPLFSVFRNQFPVGVIMEPLGIWFISPIVYVAVMPPTDVCTPAPESSMVRTVPAATILSLVSAFVRLVVSGLL
jgi:hypothetical protein